MYYIYYSEDLFLFYYAYFTVLSSLEIEQILRQMFGNLKTFLRVFLNFYVSADLPLLVLYLFTLLHHNKLF